MTSISVIVTFGDSIGDSGNGGMNSSGGYRVNWTKMAMDKWC
jgi:hypothetical protein